MRGFDSHPRLHLESIVYRTPWAIQSEFPSYIRPLLRRVFSSLVREAWAGREASHRNWPRQPARLDLRTPSPTLRPLPCRPVGFHELAGQRRRSHIGALCRGMSALATDIASITALSVEPGATTTRRHVRANDGFEGFRQFPTGENAYRSSGCAGHSTWPRAAWIFFTT